MSVLKKNEARICLVSDQLATGGAERYAAFLSQFFENNQQKVHHVIVVDKIDYEYSGELLNLGKLKNRSNGLWNRLYRFWVLYAFFRKNKFDFIIDFRVKNRQWQEFVIAKWIYNAPLIVVVQNFVTDLYFPKNRFLATRIYNHCYKIIAVSHQIKSKIETIYGYKNVAVLYNPMDFTKIEKNAAASVPSENNYIVAAGRMENNVKQIDKLIVCYAKSVLPKNGIRLLILGDGLLRQTFEELSKTLGMEDFIIFKGHVKNPYPYYKKALFLVLSSLNEGLPFVLIESLICGAPVVAFDCPSGPSEIIEDKKNGLLVADQNSEALTLALNTMSTDTGLYATCKNNAKASVEKFAIDTIGQQWLALWQA